MNSLSWMIYLAGVSDKVGSGITGLTIATGIALALSAFALIPMIVEEAEPKIWDIWRKVVWRLGIAFPILLLVGAVIPSANTVYAIAASEMGEKALNTPTATKAMKALDAWLDRQIAPEEAEGGE